MQARPAGTGDCDCRCGRHVCLDAGMDVCPQVLSPLSSECIRGAWRSTKGRFMMLVPAGIDDCPRVLSPLCSERIYLSSDVGRTSSELAKEFDHDFSELEGLWWYNEGSQDAKHIAEEPMGETFCCVSLLHRLFWGRQMGVSTACLTSVLHCLADGNRDGGAR